VTASGTKRKWPQTALAPDKTAASRLARLIHPWLDRRSLGGDQLCCDRPREHTCSVPVAAQPSIGTGPARSLIGLPAKPPPALHRRSWRPPATGEAASSCCWPGVRPRRSRASGRCGSHHNQASSREPDRGRGRTPTRRRARRGAAGEKASARDRHHRKRAGGWRFPGPQANTAGGQGQACAPAQRDSAPAETAGIAHSVSSTSVPRRSHAARRKPAPGAHHWRGCRSAVWCATAPQQNLRRARDFGFQSARRAVAQRSGGGRPSLALGGEGHHVP